jgi:ABC-type transport system substrate-binding protein
MKAGEETGVEWLGRRNRVVSIALVGLFVLLVSACGSSGSPAPSATKVPIHQGAANTLNWWANYGNAWPDSLDPAVGTSGPAIDAEYLVDANLVKFAYPSLKIVGSLAGKWTVTKGGTVYTFTIRPNARFSNGDPVTAEDAAWSITRALLPATGSKNAIVYLNHIVGAAAVAAGKTKKLTGMRVLGPKTIQMRLDKPVAFFLIALSNNVADVLDKSVMQGKPAGTYLTNTCAGNVGAGPFKFVCRNGSTNLDSFYPNGHSPYMDFVPNPFFYGSKPTITIHAPMTASSNDVLRAYQAGEIDGAMLPPADVTLAKSMKGFINVPQFDTDFITPNSQIAPFNNVHCRLAVAYAIDRVNITSKVLHGTYTPLYDILPPGILGYFGMLPSVPYYDAARAKSELSQCPGGLKNVTMTVQNAGPDIIREYDAIRSNLQKIGANLTIKPLSAIAWLKVVTQNMDTTKNQETITENLWTDDYPDPQDWLVNVLRSNAGDNVGGFSNKRFDSLVDRADLESNPAQRAKLYDDAQKIALTGGYWIAVGAVNGLYVISPRVHGLVAANGWTWPVNNDWSKVRISRT